MKEFDDIKRLMEVGIKKFIFIYLNYISDYLYLFKRLFIFIRNKNRRLFKFIRKFD